MLGGVGLPGAVSRGARGDGFAPRPVAPRLFWGAGAGAEAGRCPHKRPRETPRRLPSLLPSPPPPLLACSLLIQTSASSCGVSSVPAAAERGNGRGAGAAGKGGAPPARAGPRGAARPLRSPPEPPSSLPCSLARPPPRMTPAPPGPAPAPALCSAPLGRPLPTRLRSDPGSEEVPGEPPVCTVFYHHTHSRGLTGGLGGGGVPPSPARAGGPAGESRGLRACVGGWGAVPEKLGGSAGRLFGFAGLAVGGGRR